MKGRLLGDEKEGACTGAATIYASGVTGEALSSNRGFSQAYATSTMAKAVSAATSTITASTSSVDGLAGRRS